MNNIELVGFKKVVLDLVNNDKRQFAFDLLDYFFSKATSLYEFDVLGELALKTEYRDLHLKCAERAHAIACTSEHKRSSRNNLINAYNTMNYPEKALDYIEIQLAQTPDDFDTLCRKAANVSLLGHKKASEKIIDDLIQKYPEKASDLEPMLSSRYLRKGELAKGVATFVEPVKKESDLFVKQLGMKRWDGQSYPGKTVYIEGEGGIGDEIINVRFLKNIKDLGMRPILCSPDNKFYRDKNNLFRRHGIEVLNESFSIDKSQYWTSMMSLPAVLNLTEDDLWTDTYLKPMQNQKNKIQGGKFKIGIKCSGNPFFAQDEYRKIPLDLMVLYLPENAELYYIDKQKVDHPRVHNVAGMISSWEDTLDIVDQMDCIVSSCTSLVHIAGAIGKTTFVSVPIAEYYIWTSSSTDHSTPWYGDNFHVMKQTQLRDWNQPLAQISEKVNYMMKNQ